MKLILFPSVRRNQISKTIREITKIVQDILKEVEVQEPRFISSLNECNGHYEGNQGGRSKVSQTLILGQGLEVISPNEFEVVLYLNQMGVFNFVDDGTLPGCAVLKVSNIFSPSPLSPGNLIWFSLFFFPGQL